MDIDRIKTRIENEFSAKELHQLDVVKSGKDVIVSGTFLNRPITLRFNGDTANLDNISEHIMITGVESTPGIYFKELIHILARVQSAIRKY